MGGWEIGTVGANGCTISGVVVVDGGGPAIRLKSLPLGLPVRGEGNGAPPPPPPPGDDADDDAAAAAAAVAAAPGVPAAGDPTGVDSDVVETAGGADMRLRSFPFGGGTMIK